MAIATLNPTDAEKITNPKSAVSTNRKSAVSLLNRIRIFSRKGKKMAQENVDILPVIVNRESARANSPPIIPFTSSFALWVFCVSMSSYIIVLSTVSYWLAK
ncbi:hypothetical protein FRX31_012577, partial [Thalictrum thalictroides]